MRHSLIITSLLGALSTTASADFIGFEVGAHSWQQNYDGFVQSGSRAVDLDQQLGFVDETNNSFYILLEHPVPMLPNVMLKRTELDISATSMLTIDFDFDGSTFTANTPVSSTSDLSHTDGTLYYEILDNWVSIDIGLTVRQFDKGVEITGANRSAKLDLDYVIPLLYVGAEIELPLTGLYISAQANGISYGGDSYIDYNVNVGYETSIGAGVEAGFRSFTLDYKDDLEVADFTIDGAYVGLFFHF